MATRYQFVDDSGETRLAGFLVPEPGGSSPVTREWLQGNNVSIADSANGLLTWDSKNEGSDLLDLADPANPVVVAAGTYAFSVRASAAENLTADGFFIASFEVDINGDDATQTLNSPVATGGNLRPGVIVPITWYCPAGAVLNLTVSNRDGAASRMFVLGTALVQRLS